MAFFPTSSGGLFSQGAFQIDPNMAPEQIQRKREMLAAMMPRYGSARYIGEGLGHLAAGVVQGRQNRQLDKMEGKERDRISGLFDGLLKGGGTASGGAPILGPQPYVEPQAVDPNSPQGIANDTMVALGKTPDYAGLEAQYGLPQGYLSRTRQIESGGNPNAQNPNSSAGGDFQFIDSTARAYGLTDKTNPFASADAAARLARDNKAYLAKALGREPTGAELYLAHQQGAGGAAKLLLNGGASAASVVGGDAIALNGGDAGMTAGQFANQWLGKFDGSSAIPAGGGMDMATLAEIAASPYADPGQKAVAQQLLQQQMQAMDPRSALEMESMRLKNDAMRRDLAGGGDDRPEMVRQREYLAQLAGLQPGTPEYQQFILTGNTVGRGANEYGLTPIYGTDESGNITVMQIGKDGTAVTTKLPEGVTPNLGIKKEEEARGAEVGKMSGAAAANLEGARVTADRTLKLVDELYNDPYLDSMIGPIQGRMPNLSADAGRVQARMDQLQGSAFLEAYNMLRGGGQITEVEGKKAEDAMARLKVAQNEQDYRAALMDFRDAVETGIRKLEANAGATAFRPQAQPTGPATHRFNPQTGEIEVVQ